MEFLEIYGLLHYSAYCTCLYIVPRASTSCTAHERVFSESEDPYELWSKEKVVESMSLWPPVEYDHTYFLLFRVFTKKELMNRKGLEAYNYFQSGRVRLVKVFKARSCSILMALVNPSCWVAPRNSKKIWSYSTGGHKDILSTNFSWLHSSHGSSDTEKPSKVNFSWYLIQTTASRL